jgi:hypothetical protein
MSSPPMILQRRIRPRKRPWMIISKDSRMDSRKLRLTLESIPRITSKKLTLPLRSSRNFALILETTSSKLHQ